MARQTKEEAEDAGTVRCCGAYADISCVGTYCRGLEIVVKSENRLHHCIAEAIGLYIGLLHLADAPSAPLDDIQCIMYCWMYNIPSAVCLQAQYAVGQTCRLACRTACPWTWWGAWQQEGKLPTKCIDMLAFLYRPAKWHPLCLADMQTCLSQCLSLDLVGF